jgi:hypothetical protein
MESDKSDPRVGLIFQVAILAIITLIAVHMTLSAYFDHMNRAEIRRKVGLPEALMSLRADEKEKLSTGPVPIDQAMQMLATKGRMNASPDIVPSASKDIAPLQGWIKLPGQVPPAMTAPPPAPPTSPAPSASAAAPAASARPRHP